MFETIVRRLGGTNQSVGRFLIGCMAIGFASLVAAGLAAAWTTERTQDHGRWVSHTYDVQLAIARANVLIEQAETARRGYILTHDAAYLANYQPIAARIPVALQHIADLIQDNPGQQARLARLRTLVAEIQKSREITNALVSAGHVDRATKAFAAETSSRRMRGIRDLGAEMEAEEVRLLTVRDTDLQASARSFYVTLTLAGLLLLAVALISLATVLRYTRDLTASHDDLRKLAGSLEEQVQVRTADLSRANEEIQRFAYIVSHDLRSPLVNVMGFTAELETTTATIADLIARAEARCPEIVSDDVRAAAREDLPEAIGFIRTSTQKMDRLINAILKLSREGRRILSAEPIDMTGLIAAIGGSLQHMIDARGAQLVVEGPLPGVISDRLAIEQIFSNLIENAVKYLRPTCPGVITVRGVADRTRVIFEIEDNGRGIAESDHQRVFDLFRRAGNQDQPGEGIGLAHVRALAYRLGGIIDVHSELGKGSTFRLSLPAVPGDPQEH